MGLAWREQRGRGGRSEAPGGRGRAPGPAGPRTRRLSPRAGCCGRLDSASAAARLARCGPGGPRVLHVTSFCPRRVARPATDPEPAAPSPAEVLATPSAVLKNAILQVFVQPLHSAHSFIHSLFLPSLLTTFFQGLCQDESAQSPALPGCVAGTQIRLGCGEQEAQRFCDSWALLNVCDRP